MFLSTGKINSKKKIFNMYRLCLRPFLDTVFRNIVNVCDNFLSYKMVAFEKAKLLLKSVKHLDVSFTKDNFTKNKKYSKKHTI